MRETASGRRQAPRNVASILDAARELRIRDAQAYADGDLSDSSSAEEKCPESEQQPVTRCQAWRSLARTAQDDQLLLEQKILRDHRAHATGATQCRSHDGQVKQGEQEVLHARDSVGQTSGAMQRCLNPGFSERIGNSRRTAASDHDGPVRVVSIRAPTRGATHGRHAARLLHDVSIRAPTRGATATRRFSSSAHVVSIRAPTRGATADLGFTRNSKEFQSAPPRGGRQADRSCPRKEPGFNPRPHAGGDSKHTPTW